MKQIIAALLVFLMAQCMILSALAEEGVDVYTENTVWADTIPDAAPPAAGESAWTSASDTSPSLEDTATFQEADAPITESVPIESATPAETEPAETTAQLAGEATAPTQAETQPPVIVIPTDPIVSEETTTPTIPAEPTVPNDPTVPGDSTPNFQKYK